MKTRKRVYGGRRIYRLLVLAALLSLPGRVWTDTTVTEQPVQGELKIAIDPAVALYGVPFAISVSGLKPGEAVTVTSQSRDAGDINWEASAVFSADSEGRVNLDRSAPVSGSYGGADGLGLLWSMKPLNPRGGKERPYNFTHLDVILVRFSAVTVDGRSCQAILRRYYQLPGVGLLRMPVQENGLRGYLYAPADGKPHPGIILLTGSNGGLAEWLAQVLASNGFSTLTLAYFRYQDLPPELDEIPLEYFFTAISWMKKQPLVTKDRLALVGGSRGGELALLLSATYPGITVVAAWVPNSIVWQTESMERQAKGQACSAWSKEGRSVPYASFLVTAEDMDKIAKGTLTSTRQMADMKKLDPALLQQVTIPVEKFRGPVFIYSGSDDQTGPGDESAKMIMDRLKTHHHPYETRHIQLDGTGHFSFLPNMITGFQTFMNGGSARGDSHGGMVCWSETLAFLHRYLDR